VKAREAWGVAALCLIAGSGWLLVQCYPSELGYPFAGCIHFAVIGCTAALWAVAARKSGERRALAWVPLVSISIAGVCIFALPAAALQLVAGAISPAASVALFCSVPLMTVLCATYLPGSSGTQRLLVPGVIGMAGALLLFSVNLPGSLWRWICFVMIVAVCLVVALASVWIHQLMQGASVAGAVAAIALSCAALLGIYGETIGWPALNVALVAGEAARCVVVDLPVVWLTVWLMREVPPARLSARFLLGPLVTVLEGYAVVRGPLPVRTLAGAALLAAGGLMLLFKDESEELPGLRLR
jgi:drug/metabolite transporter (DMT)-like permease